MHTLEEYELLISTISHEIRNPITLISSYLQLITTVHPEVHSFAHWDQLLAETNYLKLLLTDLSDFRHSTSLHPLPTDLHTWLTNYAEDAEMLIQQIEEQYSAGRHLRQSAISVNMNPDTSINTHRCRFTCILPEELPVLNIDPAKLRQLLDNLIRNAAEACCANMETANFPSDIAASEYSDTRPAQTDASVHSICLVAALEASDILITITDTGCGLQNTDEKQLFTPFFSTKKDGTGLGLSIARQIAEAHHGSLTIRSVQKQETAVMLRLHIPELLPEIPQYAPHDPHRSHEFLRIR